MLSRDQSTVLVLGGDGPLGSGYLLSHGTVLTAYHVARSASWVVGGQIGRLDATVVWTDPDRDLALIETSMPDEAGYQAPLGILASRTPGIPVEVLAYPAAQRDDGKVRLEQVTGFVNPISGGPDDLHITVNSGVWIRPVQGSPWAGASGGPVFANGVLVGVVTHGGTDINRLKATRLDTMLMDPRASRLLAKHRSTGRIICTGAEFGGIVRQPAVGELGPAPLPSVLLDPRRETVPFRGRDVTLAEIEAWLTGSGVRVGVIHRGDW